MNKTKYIGIRGHRGSGKSTVAYLLGNIIQWLLDNYMTKQGLNMKYATELTNDPVFTVSYRVWCECIKTDEQFALSDMNSNNVYLETFGNTPKMLIELLTDMPHEYFNSDYYKDHVIVNISDFTWKVSEDPSHEVTYDYEALLDEIERGNITEVDDENIYLTLRDLIVYFATVSMKYLGRSVWVKTVKCNEKKYDQYEDYYNIGTRYKIFADIKAPSELDYVRNQGGTIILVERPEFKKKAKGVSTLDHDDRCDYRVTINKDILDDDELKSQLVGIAIDLVRE